MPQATLKFSRIKAARRKPQADATATPAPDAELVIFGYIGESWFADSVAAQDVVAQLAETNAQHILVRINSDGGSVSDGIAIHNALRDSGARITTRVEGVAASIASLIAMAGDDVQMHANTLMMIHAPHALVGGNAVELRNFADVLDIYAKAMAASYARKTGLSAEQILTDVLDGTDHWFTATDAQTAGYIDTITDAAAAPSDAEASNRDAVIASALMRYRTAPPAIAASVTPRVLAALRQPVHKTPATQAGSRTPAAPAASTKVSPMNWKALARALGLNVAADAEDATVKADVLNKLNLTADASDDQIAAAMLKPPAAKATAKTAATGEPTRAERIEGMFAVALRGPRASSAPLAHLRDTLLIDESVTVESARQQLLEAMNNGATPIAGHVVQGGEDSSDKRRQAMTDATLARVGKAKADGSNPYRGYKLLDIARACLEDQGINVRGKSNMELAVLASSPQVMAAGGNTTSDFPIVLENTMHKLVLSGFQAIPKTWDKFCKQGDVSDFRAWNRLVPGLIGNLDDVNEKGEYLFKNLPDATKNAIQATRKGNIIRITPEVLANDDTGYIQDTATGLGMAGGRTIERSVYALLAANPVMSDGYALFSSQHGNLAAAGAVPSVVTLDAVRSAMAKQTFPGVDAEPMDIKPAIAVAETTVEGTMRVILGSPYDPDANNKLQRQNMVYNLAGTIIGTPRIARAGAWYVFADPGYAPVIEVVFLDGQREPALLMEPHFNSGGLQWRVELPFGVGAIDYRGAYYNPGS